MDTVISKLAEIESDAVRILDDAKSKKAELSRLMDEKAKAFDAETDAATAKKLEAIKEEYRQTMEKDLAELEASTKQTMAQMEQYFQTEHDQRTDEIVKQILK